jgi:succinate dehydrogenase flavin-adding protein (antitoxin of CptAB toxin-antitoxin module)
MQWNSRGLTKSKLEEFRNLLHTEDPDFLVFLVKYLLEVKFHR